ncbi:hypothetical protein V1477_019926 [Vespula maculifrons]|uniref:Uncharacterized protein n=1 Tax=Vespula maculifrons TaxID=7453 RepID=A0ABD2AKG6_VESMC
MVQDDIRQRDEGGERYRVSWIGLGGFSISVERTWSVYSATLRLNGSYMSLELIFQRRLITSDINVSIIIVDGNNNTDENHNTFPISFFSLGDFHDCKKRIQRGVRILKV